MKLLIEILDNAADEFAERPLFVFPETRWTREEALTYADLATRSAAAAMVLSGHASAGDRALLLFATGTAFWEAFMGCLRSGIIAVPIHIPSSSRNGDALEQICQDCNPSVILTDSATAAQFRKRADIYPSLRHIPFIEPEQWRGQTGRRWRPVADVNQTAFLQYTSGSTSRPKGIQISHGNLMSNLEMIQGQMGLRVGQDVGVTWLPHYHDMGLIGSYLATLYTKNTTWCLPPEAFILHPALWLQLISREHASICGGPDFAYRLCVDKIPEDQLTEFDLTSWRVAYVGAERVRAETLRRFAERFSTCGFRDTAFFPCYGLGEATLIATGGPAETAVVIRKVSASALRSNRIQAPETPEDTTELVGCGHVFNGCDVVIRQVDSPQLLPDENVGEICLSGPSVCQGYFQRDDLNNQAFEALPIDGMDRRFLRTGDLGFLSQGVLFVTGRLKEVIIIRGRNFAPEDIEQTVVACHTALMPGGVIAFAVDANGIESLIIAAELQRSSLKDQSFEAVVLAIRNRVVEVFGINPADILLLRPASLPRTSSGKPRRVSLRDSYADGTLSFLFHQSVM